MIHLHPTISLKTFLQILHPNSRFRNNPPAALLISVFVVSSSQDCSNYAFTSNIFDHCINLSALDTHLHWSFSKFTKKVSIAYRAKVSSSGWTAWGINPRGLGMIGSQAIVAFQNSIGGLTVYTTAVTSYRPSMLPESLSIQISDVSAEYVDREMILFAVVGPLLNGTTVNHVWQVGNTVLGNTPQMHPLSLSNLQAMGILDFSLGS